MPNSKSSTPTLEYNRYFILPFLNYLGGEIFPCLVIWNIKGKKPS